MMKSDPIQGILFNSEPTHLQARAAKRATLHDMVTTKPTVFFQKIQNIKVAGKTGAERLSRTRTKLRIK